jgi:hypothetical protein
MVHLAMDDDAYHAPYAGAAALPKYASIRRRVPGEVAVAAVAGACASEGGGAGAALWQAAASKT